MTTELHIALYRQRVFTTSAPARCPRPCVTWSRWADDNRFLTRRIKAIAIHTLVLGSS